MSEVETSIDIDAPPEEVWALAMDPNRLADWVTIHRRLDDHSDGRPRAGYESPIVHPPPGPQASARPVPPDPAGGAGPARAPALPRDAPARATRWSRPCACAA